MNSETLIGTLGRLWGRLLRFIVVLLKWLRSAGYKLTGALSAR